MTHIFLIRHGESTQNTGLNFKERLPDHAIPLTENGIIQAKKAGEFLDNWYREKYGEIRRGRLWVSPYMRTRQTATELNKVLNIKDIREDDMLVEMQFGVFDNIPKDKIADIFPTEYAVYKNDREYMGKFFARRHGGESPMDVVIRQRIFLDTLFRDINQGDCPNVIVIVGHGAQLTCLRKAMFHYSHEWYEAEPNPLNCSIQHIILNNKKNVDAGYIYGHPMDER